jgi:hypothetical protein
MIYVIDKTAAEHIIHHFDELQRRGIEVENIDDGKASQKVADLGFSRNPETGLMG